MWRFGFFLHEMAFGLLSVFLPLYVMSIGGSLVTIGLMTATALFAVIPASFFWGYLCDKTRRFKRYILVSFLASSAILCMFTFTTNVNFLIVLYTVMSVFHIAHEPPKNILIAELYSRKEWEKSFAFYEGLTEVGWLVGLILGFTAATYGVSQFSTLLLCSLLNLAAFLISLVLVADPLLIFERGLVSIERSIDFAYRGTLLVSRAWSGTPLDGGFKRESLGAFAIGLVLFSLGTSILFTPMPIFVAGIIRDAALPASFVFSIFVLNSGGAVIGYFLAGKSLPETGKRKIGRLVLFRSFLAFSLIVLVQVSIISVLIITAILALMGLAFAVFLVYTLSLSMELIPPGKAGLFNVLSGIGGACGSFVGPFIAETLGFRYVFLVGGTLFLLTYFTFRLFSS